MKARREIYTKDDVAGIATLDNHQDVLSLDFTRSSVGT